MCEEHRKWEDFVVPEGEAMEEEEEEEEEEANEYVEEQTEAYASEADNGASEEYLGCDASPTNQGERARPAEPLSGHSEQARRAARERRQDAPDWVEADDYLSLTDELERRLRKLEIKRRRLMSEFSADMERKKREVSRQRTLVAQDRQRLRQRARKRARQARTGCHPLILKQEEITSDE